MSSTNTTADDPAALAAQAEAIAAATAAFRQFTIELWTLFSIGALVTILRTYARVKSVGLRKLGVDDYLVWLGLIGYASQCSLGFSIGNIAKGFANNGMAPEERAALDPASEEYHLRVIGSQIQVAGWTVYSTLIWSLKLSMLFFYIRLTEGLDRRYRLRIYAGFALVFVTFLVTILCIYLGCQPVSHYWQVFPDPGKHCYPATSDLIVWSSFAANVTTDIYLILIPLPLLWGSTLKLPRKIASTVVLGAGIFVLVCAILKTVYVLVDPVEGAQLAGQWGTREAFTAVVTTNLPMIFPLLRQWFSPFFPTALRSSKKEYKTPAGVRTIGGGGGGYPSSKSKGKDAGQFNTITGNLTFTESEERMMTMTDNNNNNNIRLHGLKGIHNSSSVEAREPSSRGGSSERAARDGIMVSREVEVRSEDRASQNGDIPRSQRAHEHL